MFIATKTEDDDVARAGMESVADIQRPISQELEKVYQGLGMEGGIYAKCTVSELEQYRYFPPELPKEDFNVPAIRHQQHGEPSGYFVSFKDEPKLSVTSVLKALNHRKLHISSRRLRSGEYEPYPDMNLTTTKAIWALPGAKAQRELGYTLSKHDASHWRPTDRNEILIVCNEGVIVMAARHHNE